MAINFQVKVDNTDLCIQEMKDACKRALENIGITMEDYAADNIRAAGRVDTGNLAGSIDHEATETQVIVGTNVPYAAYHEFGTGEHAESGATSGYWVYVPGGGGSGRRSGKRYDAATARKIVAMLRSKGIDAHMTSGVTPIHFLKKAAADHTAEYADILEHELRG